MKPPRCRVCGHEHWLRDPHVFSPSPSRVTASNGASNSANDSEAAINGVHLTGGKRDGDDSRKTVGHEAGKVGREKPKGVVSAEQAVGQVPAAVASDTKQRWSREKYNAYMREYMKEMRRKRREAARAGL